MNELFLKHGSISWTELMTKDVEAAKKFYGTLFGWTFKEMSMPNMTYTVAKVGDREFGGILKNPPGAEGMPPAWTSYVTVENVDETAKNVKELGGKVIVPPMDIPEVGRFCVIQDPVGASIAAITYVKK